MNDELRKKMALFKYSLIAPLITETFIQDNAKEYLIDVCSRRYDTPDGSQREFAPTTLKDWLRLYRLYGIDGLYPKRRSDKGNSRKLSSTAKEYIVEAKISSPKKTAKAIYQELIARGYINYNDISLSTVQRFISKEKLSSKKLEPLDRRAFEFEFANECWQSDISVGPYITVNGKKHKTYIIAIIDDATRLIIHCEAFFFDNLMAVLSVFKKGVSKRGIPKKLFVDNGKVYRSDQMQFICASLGTILCFARPYSPESKGKIERWFKTLKDQWVNVIDWSGFNSLEELNESLNRYVEGDYNIRAHSAIGISPMDKFLGHIEDLRFINSKEELNYIFLYRVSRKVKNDATISIDTVAFEVPMKYIGDRVNIRYDATCMDKAYIFSDDGKVLDTIYPLKKIDNSKIRRADNFKPVDFSCFSDGR
jgi:transposase InsO family protein